jgi:hypothetical protein
MITGKGEDTSSGMTLNFKLIWKIVNSLGCWGGKEMEGEYCKQIDEHKEVHCLVSRL